MSVLRRTIKTMLALLAVCQLQVVFASELDDIQRLADDGNFKQVLGRVQALLAKQPGNERALFLRALSQQNLGLTEEAIKNYEALTVSHPKSPEAWNNLGVLYAAKGEHNKARDALLSAINSHPSYATAYENLGNIYAKMAVSAYNRALENGKKDQAGPIELASISSLPKDKGIIIEPTVVPAAPVTTVASNAPLPAPVITTASNEREIRDITDTVNGWISAWSAQNVDGYLAYYAPGFKPANGLSRSRWENQRRDRLQSPRFIKISMKNTDVFLIDAQSARFSFEQAYTSDSYSDVSRKTLVLKKVNGQWQILREYAEG